MYIKVDNNFLTASFSPPYFRLNVNENYLFLFITFYPRYPPYIL